MAFRLLEGELVHMNRGLGISFIIMDSQGVSVDTDGDVMYFTLANESQSLLYADLLKQGLSSSMTTMDNRVGEEQGGVAATYCIDYRVLCVVSQLV
jgi:hypothetical protein